MRYSTSSGSDTLAPVAVSELSTGGGATIKVYDLSDGTEVDLDSTTCTEIASTGIWRWSASNISTYPSTETNYMFIMTHTVTGAGRAGKFTFGGVMDSIAQTGNSYPTVNTNLDATISSVATTLGTPAGADISTDIASIQTDTTKILQVESGKWTRSGSQIIFYDSDGSTPLYTFTIKDENGTNCTDSSNVFQRVPA